MVAGYWNLFYICIHQRNLEHPILHLKFHDGIEDSAKPFTRSQIVKTSINAPF